MLGLRIRGAAANSTDKAAGRTTLDEVVSTVKAVGVSEQVNGVGVVTVSHFLCRRSL